MTNTALATTTPPPEPPITLTPATLGPETLKQQRYIPLNLIHPSPFNPRKDFDEAGIAELAESIRVNGLQQNLVVRPHPTKKEHWELMGGERRWRALNLLKAEGAVCKIEEATDAESIGRQLIENLQREDVEPMAEAQAFADLQKLDPVRYSPANVAASIGKSKRFVLQRISLVTNTSAELQEAMKSGQGMKIETARTLAALPQSLQKEIVDRNRYNLANLSAEGVREYAAEIAVPVSTAAFDAALYTGEIIEENGKRYFGDVALFTKLQTVAAKAKVETLKADWPQAKLVKEAALANWQWADTGREVRWAKDHKPAGKPPKIATAIVYIDTDHKIRTAEGVKPYVQQSYSYSSAPSCKETPERKVVREAFNAQLIAAFAKDPAVALRFMLLDMVSGDGGLNISGEILKRALPGIDIKGHWMSYPEKAKHWPKFAALSDAAVTGAFRMLALGQLDADTYSWDANQKDCDPLLIALGASLGVKPQAEKPIAPPESKTAEPKKPGHGPPWPTDHPGRRCSLCKLGVYNLWIDTAPPPGSCVEGATSADQCRQNVSGAVWQACMAIIVAGPDGDLKPLHDRLAERGLQADRIIAYARDHLGAQEEGRHLFTAASIVVDGMNIFDWLHGPPGTTEADTDRTLRRAAALLRILAYHLQVAVDYSNEAETDAWLDRLRYAFRSATEELFDTDSYVGDGEEPGEEGEG